MSNDFFRVNKGVKLNPTDEPALTEQGQLYLDNNDNATKLVGVIKAIDPNITTNAIEFDGASSEIAITSATYGTVTITPDNQVGIVANNTVKLPVSNTASVDVLVARDTADTLTNKTINTNDNTIEIASTQITATTGTGGVVVVDTSPTINSPSLVTPTLGDATVTSITGSATADLVINSDPAYELEMQGNNVLVKTFNNALAASTGFINIKTGDQTGTSNSGNVDINTGDSDASTSGNINIVTGDTTASPSGDINISSGMSVSSFRGAVNLDGSAVNVSPNTLNFGPYDPLAAAYPLTITSNPDVYFSLSDSFGMGADAFEVTSLNQVEITAGSGNASLKAESGDIYLKGTNAYIGPILIPSGGYALQVSHDGTATNLNAQNLVIESATTGDVQIQGSDLLFKTFDDATTNPTGTLEIYTGDQTGTAVSGQILIKTGNTVGDSSGGIQINTGTTDAVPSGPIVISTGTSASSTKGYVTVDGSTINMTTELINVGPYSSAKNGYPLQINSELTGQNVFEFQLNNILFRTRQENTGGTNSLYFSSGIAGDPSAPPLDSGNSGSIVFNTGDSLGTSTGRSGNMSFTTGNVFGSEAPGDMFFVTGYSYGTTSGGNMYFEAGMNDSGVAPRGTINFAAGSFGYYIGQYNLQNAGDSIDTTGYYLGIENSTNTPRSIKFQGGSGNVVSLNSPSSLSATYSITFPNTAPTTGAFLGYNGSIMDWYGILPSITSQTATFGQPTIPIDTTTKNLNQTIIIQTTGGNTIMSGALFGTTAPVLDGTVIRLIGANDSNNVTLTSSDIAYGLVLNGNATLSKNYVLTLQYIGTLNRYVEISRNF